MRKRCSYCERSRPDAETTLVSGHGRGDYRRAGRRMDRRVCVDCTRERVDYARRGQTATPRLNTPVDDHYFQWSQAARYFGIDLNGLFLRSGGPVVTDNPEGGIKT